MEKLQHKLGDAANGSKEVAEAFQKQGLDAKALAELPLEQTLGKIADQFNQIAPGAQRVSFLVELFGKAGAELAPMLAKGSAGMEAAKQKAQQLGLALTDADVSAARAAEKGLKQFDGLLKGVWMQIANQLNPVLLVLKDYLGNVGAQGETVGTMVAKAAQAMVEALKWVARQVDKVHAGFLALKGGVQSLAFTARFAASGFSSEKGRQLAQEWADNQREIRRLWNSNGDNEATRALDRLIADVQKKRQQIKDEVNKDKADLINPAVFSAALDAQKRLESLKSPFEKWKDDIALFNQWLKMTAINEETFGRLVADSTKKLVDQQRVERNAPPGALVLGSAAEFSARNAVSRGGDLSWQEKLLRLQEEEARAAKGIEKNTKDTLDFIKKSGVAVVGMNK